MYPYFDVAARDNVNLANLDEYVPFLGDLHQQMKDVPDAAKSGSLLDRNQGEPGKNLELRGMHPNSRFLLASESQAER